jgi:hypothetical protein
VKPLGSLADLNKMKQQLPVYLTRALNFSTDNSSVEDFSNAVLAWWKENSDDQISAWAEAAQIVFAISPNSASCGREGGLGTVGFINFLEKVGRKLRCCDQKV